MQQSSLITQLQSDQTALQSHILWSCRLFFFVEFNGEGQNSNRNTVKHTAEMAEKFWVTKMRPVSRHLCQASRIRGCETVLNLTGRIRFITVGHLQRKDSGWSWTFGIARAIFLFKFRPRSDFHHCLGKNLSDHSLGFWTAVFLWDQL